MTYVAKRFYLETQEASVIGRAANRQDAIEILCEGIVDTYEVAEEKDSDVDSVGAQDEEPVYG